MPSFCAVAFCEFKYAQTTNISFHKFPFHTTHLLNQWTAFTNRGALWQPSRWSSICSRHFRLSDYRDHLFRKCLKRTAVPSVRVQLPFAFVAATMDYESSTTFPSHGADSQISEAADIVVGEQRDPERSHQLLASCPSPAVASTPLPSSQYLQYCRLCANTDPGTRRLDETTIADILHKYVTLDPDDRLSQLVCSDCLLQLNRFVQFVDRIVSMQSELMQRLVNKAMPCSLPATQSTPDIYSQAPTETKAAANSMAIPLPPTSAPLFIASRQSQTPTVTATAANPPPKLIHIKQEPVQLLANVKQEFSDSNRNAAAQLPSKHAPTLECQPDVDAFCETCDVYFINNLELKTHIINCHKSTSNVIPFTKSHHLPDQDLSIQPNSNCEIMEIITLENTFINLAEEAEPVCDIDEAIAVTADDMIPLERVLKVEHFNDYEQRELQLAVIRREHNYNRRLETAELQPRILGDFKQEFKSNESAMEAAVVLQSLSSLMPANSALLADQVNKTGEHMQHANLPASRTMTLPSIYQCAICAFRCTSLSPLQRHIATTHRQFKCSQCVRTFRSRLLRLSHQQFAHRRIALPYRRTPITLLCTNCSHQFYAKAAWRNHRIVCDRWHSVVKPVLSTRGSQRSRALSRIRFMIMSRLMTSAGRLRGQTMQPMPRFECGTCKRAFGHYLSYKRHLKLHQPVTDPLSSQATFTPHDQQIYDDKTTNVTQKRFTCPDCHAQFTLQQTYQDHLNSAHPKMPPPPLMPVASKTAKTFVCPKCNKPFRCAENLRQHTITHSTERNYACSLCDKVFKRSSGLKQHVQGFHYKIRPHVCTVCQYAYALKGDMKRCRHSSLKTPPPVDNAVLLKS